MLTELVADFGNVSIPMKEKDTTKDAGNLLIANKSLAVVEGSVKSENKAMVLEEEKGDAKTSEPAEEREEAPKESDTKTSAKEAESSRDQAPPETEEPADEEVSSVPDKSLPSKAGE